MSLTKRIDQAREAFTRKDLTASAEAHQPERIAQAPEEHGSVGGLYLGDMVYGGLDGIITTFAIVSGVAGANLGPEIVIILGIANLLADGFSMATGAYLSSKSEREYYDREWRREAWEVEHFPEGERAELYEIYREDGYSESEANELVAIKSRQPDRWIKAMMVDELGMLPDERKPLLSGLATFIAFVIAGSFPLLVFLLGLVVDIPQSLAFPTAVVLSGLALFALGAAKSFVTRLSPLRSGFEMLLVGGLAAAVAYAVGALLGGLG